MIKPMNLFRRGFGRGMAVVACMAFAAAGAQAQTHWVWDTNASVWNNGNITQPTFQLKGLGGTATTLQVGDKTFGFPEADLTVSSNAGNQTAIRDAIVVSGYFTGPDEPGLLFSSDVANLITVNDSNSLIDIAFGFTVTAPGDLIIGARMVIPGDGATKVPGSTAGDDAISISENVYAVSKLNPPPLASLLVGVPEQFFVDGDLLMYDLGPFPARSFVAIEKNIILQSQVVDGGSVTLHHFAQTFQQVPEPGTVALVAAGGLLMLPRRRKPALSV